MFDKKQESQGVSPVVGVILMVAITVIIAAVVAQFVLDLGGNLESDADATVSFDQSVESFSEDTYFVEVSVSDLKTSDYLVVTTQGRTLTSNISVQRGGTDPANVTDAPNNPAGSATLNSDNTGAIAVSSGDNVVLGEGLGANALEDGDVVQVFGAIDGSESLITTYEVEEPR